MDNIYEFLIDKIKEKHLVNEIMLEYYISENRRKYDNVMREFNSSVLIIHNEDSVQRMIFGNNYTKCIDLYFYKKVLIRSKIYIRQFTVNTPFALLDEYNIFYTKNYNELNSFSF